jgi:hypothetical protein
MRTRVAETDDPSDILTPSLVLNRSVESVKRPRQGWEDAFRSMSARSDDELLDGNLLNHDCDDDK